MYEYLEYTLNIFKVNCSGKVTTNINEPVIDVIDGQS